MLSTSLSARKLSFALRILPMILLVSAVFILAGSGKTSGDSSARRSGSHALAKTQKARVAPTASSGSASLLTITGSGSATANGDYVSPPGGMDEPYRYFIEVPPGLSRLQVDIFDADVGAGGSGEAASGRDRARGSFDSSVSYSLIDPSGVSRPVNFNSGNNAGPSGADNAWLTLYSATGNNVRDNFGTGAYTNNDGNNNWAAAWVESDGGGGGATGGAIRITGGQLRLHDEVSGTPGIEREVDLLGTPGLNLGSAFFSFDFDTSDNLDDDDQITVQVSSNGGGAWTTLETFSNDGTGSRSYNITAFIANNTRIRFLVADGEFDGNGGNEFFFVDNVRIGDDGDAAPAAGHWELRIDMSSSVTSGDDINALGIRAHDGDSTSGGTELNLYVDSIDGFGVNPPASGTTSKTYATHPFITSGCACGKNDFDYDSDAGNTGSLVFTSRTGGFVQSYNSSALSTNNAWRRDSFSGWTSDSLASDYGIWSAGITLTSYVEGGTPNGNYVNFFMSNFQAAANPPTVNPVANTFRMYLRTDAGGVPVKPFMSQAVSVISGPNPPLVGQTTRVEVVVTMANPTGRPIVFSTPSNVVTANVPGTGAVYAGGAAVSQGSLVSQPAVNGTGNVIWNPGTVAAGTTANFSYNVDVTPTASGQRVRVTATPASGSGTRAQYVDETGNATQARASYLFGPLCELAITQGLFTAIDQVDFAAAIYDGGVFLKWKTGQEVDNLGFNIYREEAGQKSLVNRNILAGSALMIGPGTALRSGQSYGWWDSVAGTKEGVIYWLEDIDLNGNRTMHGPFKPEFTGGKPPALSQAEALSQLGRREPRVSALPLHERESQAPGRAQFETQNLLASSPSLKVVTREEGWHRITQPELVAAGLDANADPRMLRFFLEGQEHAIVVTGEEDGRFDPSDFIEFYASRKESPLADTSVYWLSPGNQAGRRVSKERIEGKPGGSASFACKVEQKERSIYFSSLRNGEKENFFGSVVSSEGVNQALNISNVELSSEHAAELEIALQGVTDLPGTPDHQVKISLNGTDLGRVIFDGRGNQAERFILSHSLLREGENTLTLKSEAGASDVSLVDYIRLTYRHTYRADQDHLRLTAQSDSPAAYTIEGFSSSEVRVVDVSDRANPVELEGVVTPQDKKGATGIHSITVGVPGGEPRDLLAFASGRIRRPVLVTANRPSSLRQTSNGADLVIISRREFESSLGPLITLRKSQGLSVALVDADDIYDEFSFGAKSPTALRDFLAYTNTSWKRKPRYVLLAGESSLDPKNYLGFGDLDLVPTKLIDTDQLETSSDDWLADFDGDGLAELALGRLPFRSTGESSIMIAKILDYERARPYQEIMLVADVSDSYNFEQASANLSTLVPSAVRVNRINRGQADTDTARAQLLAAINRGQKIVNYTGHGNIDAWRGNLLTSEIALTLENRERPSVFVMMSCLNGYVQDVAVDSLAESLMKSARGGAMAVWASSGLSTPDEQALMNRKLFEALFTGPGVKPLGDAVRTAKAAVSNPDIRKTWILLGDPTTRFK